MIKKKIIKILKIILILLTIYVIYSIGMIAGVIAGIDLTQKHHNSSIIELIAEIGNMTIDNEGYLILGNGTYNIKKECYFGKFKINGKKELNKFQKGLQYPKDLLYYPVLRCI